MIAVDAPVLIELLTDGPRADAVEAGLRQSLGSGRVVVCDAALAQLCASLRNGAEALAALEEMGVHFNAVEAKSALRAGEIAHDSLIVQRREQAFGIFGPDWPQQQSLRSCKHYVSPVLPAPMPPEGDRLESKP